jgi:hypothetical protein
MGSSFTYKNSAMPLETFGNPLSINGEVQQPQTLYSTDGWIKLSISGGVAPYIVHVMSTFSPAQVFKKDHIELKKLGTGNYTIMVQDAEKHVVQKTIELTPVQ